MDLKYPQNPLRFPRCPSPTESPCPLAHDASAVLRAPLNSELLTPAAGESHLALQSNVCVHETRRGTALRMIFARFPGRKSCGPSTLPDSDSKHFRTSLRLGARRREAAQPPHPRTMQRTARARFPVPSVSVAWGVRCLWRRESCRKCTKTSAVTEAAERRNVDDTPHQKRGRDCEAVFRLGDSTWTCTYPGKAWY